MIQKSLQSRVVSPMTETITLLTVHVTCCSFGTSIWGKQPPSRHLNKLEDQDLSGCIRVMPWKSVSHFEIKSPPATVSIVHCYASPFFCHKMMVMMPWCWFLICILTENTIYSHQSKILRKFTAPANTTVKCTHVTATFANRIFTIIARLE